MQTTYKCADCDKEEKYQADLLQCKVCKLHRCRECTAKQYLNNNFNCAGDLDWRRINWARGVLKVIDNKYKYETVKGEIRDAGMSARADAKKDMADPKLAEAYSKHSTSTDTRCAPSQSWSVSWLELKRPSLAVPPFPRSPSSRHSSSILPSKTASLDNVLPQNT